MQHHDLGEPRVIALRPRITQVRIGFQRQSGDILRLEDLLAIALHAQLVTLGEDHPQIGREHLVLAAAHAENDDVQLGLQSRCPDRASRERRAGQDDDLGQVVGDAEVIGDI